MVESRTNAVDVSRRKRDRVSAALEREKQDIRDGQCTRQWLCGYTFPKCARTFTSSGCSVNDVATRSRLLARFAGGVGNGRRVTRNTPPPGAHSSSYPGPASGNAG